MAALHQTMAHTNATGFREMIVLAIRAALSRLYRDAIVSDRKTNARYRDVAAAFRIETIGVRAVMRRVDGEAGSDQVFAALRMDCP